MTAAIHLLIIEESPAVRTALVRRLKSFPQIAVTAIAHATDAAQPGALPAADVALLRIRNKDDEELDSTLALVRGLAQGGSAVIVLTPFPNAVEQTLLQEAGAARYLPMTVNTPGLLAAIRDLVPTAVHDAPCAPPASAA